MHRFTRSTCRRLGALVLCGSAIAAAPMAAQGVNCNQPATQAVTHVEVPGSPFEPIPTSDGCWILVTLARANQATTGGLVVLDRGGGKVSVVRTISLKGNPTGAVLTHDGRLLVIAAGPMVAFVDVARATSGHGNPVVGYLDMGKPIGAIYVNVTADDRLLFVAAESAGGVIVIDLAKGGTLRVPKTDAIVGMIPTGRAPIALTFSSDERYLYTTSQAAQSDWNWPPACKPEAQAAATAAITQPQGAIVVVDVRQAARDPEHSVVARVPAGCNPVRLVLSPAGDLAYVSARGENALLTFDTGKLLTDSAHARLGRVPLGTAPVGVAVTDSGRRIVVTNSNRFGGNADDKQPLSVVDATRIAEGAAAVLGTIPAGAFPRELRVTADGRTMLVTNFNSRTLELIDLERARPQPTPP